MLGYGYLRSFARSLAAAPTRVVRRTVTVLRGGYDAAQDGDESRRHWANADDKSARAANSPDVRRKLRKRARYEAANNPNIGGLLRTMAYDLIGTGPRLQLTLPDVETGSLTGATSGDREMELTGKRAARQKAARFIEKKFAAWARAGRYADKLRVMATQKPRDGEAFAVMVTNPAVASPVQLDLRLVEPEQVATPDLRWDDPLACDGVRFDRWGNPAEYTVLKYHPGDSVGGNPSAYDVFPAARVVHWFRPDRAGQLRGVPEIAPMLPIAAYQRRYLLATVSAAETAASIAGVLETDVPAPTGDEGESGSPADFDRVEIERGALMTSPAGWKMKQFEPEQPTGTFKEFNGELLAAMGRAVDAPFNVIAGNSSGYNYSSGRLDHLGYHRTLWVERDRLRHVCLDPVFREWVREALLVGGIVPDDLPPVDEWEWDWHWDGFGSIDPGKDAEAAKARLDARLSTMSEEQAAEGKDWEAVMRQQAAENALAATLELPLPFPPAPAPAEPKPGGPPAKKPDQEPTNAA